MWSMCLRGRLALAVVVTKAAAHDARHHGTGNGIVSSQVHVPPCPSSATRRWCDANEGPVDVLLRTASSAAPLCVTVGPFGGTEFRTRMLVAAAHVICNLICAWMVFMPHKVRVSPLAFAAAAVNSTPGTSQSLSNFRLPRFTTKTVVDTCVVCGLSARALRWRVLCVLV